MKTEYCNLQTDYKTLKTENNQLKLKVIVLFLSTWSIIKSKDFLNKNYGDFI